MFVSILTYNVEHKINFCTVSSFFFHVVGVVEEDYYEHLSPLLMMLPKLTQSFFSPLAVPDSVVITFYLPVKTGEVLIGKQWEPVYLFPPIWSHAGGGIPNIATAQTSSVAVHAHARAHVSQ